MTRKDMILVAVVVNAGLLAILFVTAIIYDGDKDIEQVMSPNSIASIQETTPSTPSPAASVVSTPLPSSGDEVDNVLNYYANTSTTPQHVAMETAPQTFVIETAPQAEEEVLTHTQQPVDSEPSSDFIEVTVKKGDVLEKIARANGSSVSAIKKANQLKSEKQLKIGQVLKIPKKEKASTKPAAQPSSAESSGNEEAVYHVIKNGDSPWKIAKQYGVDYADILILNGMDEDKAKNLKIGDKIRVK